jgi:hypothetical protein
MTERQIKAIEKREKAATPGPWRVSHDVRFIEIERRADVQFINHARKDVSDLLAEVRRLQVALRQSDEFLTAAYMFGLHEGKRAREDNQKCLQ